MNILTYITPIVAFLGIILSIISILYTRHQIKDALMLILNSTIQDIIDSKRYVILK